MIQSRGESRWMVNLKLIDASLNHKAAHLLQDFEAINETPVAFR